jgi:hypothetical protein
MKPDDDPAERLRQALDLYDVGVDVMRQNLRRQHPDAGEEEIDALLAAWLEQRPGAEHGDAEGSPVDWNERIAQRRS